jgi:peroxiredoxin Q/BCP
MLEQGTKAPEIVLNDKDGNEVKLSDFKGQRVVVYFYPRDNTPGCTRQACAFRDEFEEYKALGIPVLGISKDSEASHQRFAMKNELPFILLADPELKSIKDYDVWQEKKMYGKVSMGVVRATYLIGADGIIEKVWKKAKPDTNAKEILEYINS